MEKKITNEKIHVKYVNENYKRCLKNKINNNLPQSYHPRIKFINKKLLKKDSIIKDTLQKRKLDDIENSTEQEETDSNYNSNIKKRKYEEDLIFNDKIIEIEASRCFNKKIDESLTKFYLYDFEMNENCLWSIANHYDNLNEWKKISIILGLEICDVQMIQAKYLISDGLKECFYQSLLKWRLKKPENCYLNYFLNKLYINLNKTFDFINKLKDDLTSKKTKNKTILNMFQFYLTGLERKYEICLDKKKVSIKLNENQLWSASAYIFQEWKAISRTLNLNELDLISIETKYLQSDGIRECCYQSLLKWSQFYYEETSLENLCLSLIQMKFNLYAKQLLEEFCF